MCPLWYRAITSKCSCEKEGVKCLLDHDKTCEYRIHYWNLLDTYPDLEDHWLYANMYKDMMYKNDN